VPPGSPPLYGDSCYLEPHINFTYTGMRMEGFSSAIGITEAGHRCLQLPECAAVVESPFPNPAHSHVLRYVMRKEGGMLVSMPGTTTIMRSENHCVPPSPPSNPMFVMQTRPAFLVTYVATVSVPMVSFDVPAYVARTRARFNTEAVCVTMAAGSVIITTELGADDEETANGLVGGVNGMDSNELESLFDAPAVVNSVTSAANPDAVAPPPSGPPSRSEEDHVVLSVIIISIILVPVGIFLVYLWYDKGKKVPKSPPPPESSSMAAVGGKGSKPYTRVTTNELAGPPVAGLNFRFEF
tara:strand:- start:1491 stop:2381 length:891 start_codon:yes stop_codon:yes gene_type:complete